MTNPHAVCALLPSLLLFAAGPPAMSEESQDFSPPVEEQQLPGAMRSRMDEQPRISVGLRDADIVGADNRALQAAVDYVAGLGGGTVEIGPGEFVIRFLRNVSVEVNT